MGRRKKRLTKRQAKLDRLLHSRTAGHRLVQRGRTVWLRVYDRPRSERPPAFLVRAQAVVLSIACRHPKELGRLEGTSRQQDIADEAAKRGTVLSRSTVQRILARAEVKPHKERYYLFTNKERPDHEARRDAICDANQRELPARMVDQVLSQVPVRQWVLTLPWDLRLLLAWRHDLARGVLRVALRVIQRCYRDRVSASGRGHGARTSSVTVLQRFGSDLRLNPHFHVLVLDGAFLRDEHVHDLPLGCRTQTTSERGTLR